MKLAAQKPGMIGEFYNLYKLSIGRFARDDETVLRQLLLIFWIELEPVPVSLADLAAAINLLGERAGSQKARIGPQPHCTSQFLNPDQVSQLEYHGVRRVFVKFS